jgi:quercetin dioxygenase-like cupin family protein
VPKRAGAAVRLPRGLRPAAKSRKAGDLEVAFAHDLPPLEGGRLSVTLVEVNYRPGESSAPHRHPCPVIGYILEGRVRTQVQGEREATYKSGESFYEGPGAVHLLSANASETEPARMLAYLVCDTRAPLSVDVPQSKPDGEN